VLAGPTGRPAGFKGPRPAKDGYSNAVQGSASTEPEREQRVTKPLLGLSRNKNGRRGCEKKNASGEIPQFRRKVKPGGDRSGPSCSAAGDFIDAQSASPKGRGFRRLVVGRPRFSGGGDSTNGAKGGIARYRAPFRPAFVSRHRFMRGMTKWPGIMGTVRARRRTPRSSKGCVKADKFAVDQRLDFPAREGDLRRDPANRETSEGLERRRFPSLSGKERPPGRRERPKPKAKPQKKQ